VVEVVSEGGEDRDYNEKREEYLRVGVTEYWILDPRTRVMKVLQRAGDVWGEVTVAADATYRPHLLPGLEVRPGELLGNAEDE
jgi:Uma2 family endonuclease